MTLFRCALLSAILFYSGNAHAGAWTEPEGGGQVITTVSNYATDSFFNAHSDRVDQTSSYHKSEVDVYAEYGLTPAYTIGFQPSYQWVHIRSSTGDTNNNGLADTAFFLRERIWHNDNNVFSLQELGTVPGAYDKNNPASLGYHQSDVEMRALYGNSGTVVSLPYFADAEGAYRERFEGPADEIHLDLTLGIKPIGGFMILAQSFNTIGMRDASTSAFVTPSGPDYDLSKVQLSGVIDIPYGISFQLGGSDDISGRNTGGGRSVFIAFWRNF